MALEQQADMSSDSERTYILIQLKPHVSKLSSELGAIYQNSPCKPYEVHAEESFLIAHLLSAPHRFVPDAHAVLVGAHLSPPKPGGPAQDHGAGLLHLLDRDVSALQEVRARNSFTFPAIALASISPWLIHQIAG